MIVRLSLRFCVFNLNETRSFSANCADIVRRVQQTGGRENAKMGA